MGTTRMSSSSMPMLVRTSGYTDPGQTDIPLRGLSVSSGRVRVRNVRRLSGICPGSVRTGRQTNDGQQTMKTADPKSTEPRPDPWRRMLDALTGSAPAGPPPAAPGQRVRVHRRPVAPSFVPSPEGLAVLRQWVRRR